MGRKSLKKIHPDWTEEDIKNYIRMKGRERQKRFYNNHKEDVKEERKEYYKKNKERMNLNNKRNYYLKKNRLDDFNKKYPNFKMV